MLIYFINSVNLNVISMKLILSSPPLINFYIISSTFILMQFVLRFMIAAGSRPSESIYNFVLFLYGHFIGNIIFLFPFYFWYKISIGVGVLSMIFCFICLFVTPLILSIVSRIPLIVQLAHLYIRVGFFLIPYLVYQIVTFNYSPFQI